MNDRLTTTEAQRQPTHDYLSGASDPGRPASNVTWNVDRYGYVPRWPPPAAESPRRDSRQYINLKTCQPGLVTNEN